MGINRDTKLPSHKERLKAYLLEGNMVNWMIAEAEISIAKPFYVRSLPQRIQEIDNELQAEGIGVIIGTKEYNPQRTEYRFEKYTDEDIVNRDTQYEQTTT